MRWIAGLGAALVYALVVYALTVWAAPDRGMLLIAFMVGAPMAGAIVAVLVSDPHGRQRSGQHVATGVVTVTLMLIAAAVVLREGAVCLVMAAPLFYGVGVTGALLAGAVARRRGGRTLCVAFLVLPLIGLPAELDQPPRGQTRWVGSWVTIDAPPEVVWRSLVEIKGIAPDEQSWNFTHDLVGVPRPVDARMNGEGVGAVRELTWARGIKFEEHITEWRPGRSLAWTFRVGPEASSRMLDQHLRIDSDYLRLEEGRYEIEAIGHERSRVRLTTRYWMRTPMNAYAAWWGRVFLGDFHHNVLDVIKSRSEAA